MGQVTCWDSGGPSVYILSSGIYSHTPINMLKNVHELFPAHVHAVLRTCVWRYVGLCLNNVMHPRQVLYQLNYIPTGEV